MRTKTLNQIAREATEYAVETLDIERALVVKQARDEERASVEMRTGIGDNIVNICRESALLIAADLVRLNPHLIANIESKLYVYLENLPDEIEHHMPDYDLYKDYANEEIEKGRNRSAVSDYLDYSIGFATRGCFRKCSFCVNKKYDKAFVHSPVNEFYDPARPYIYLWDDNFLAFSGWESILDDLEATGKPFQFRQGIDIRLMTDRKAKRLSETRYHGDFIFAFDHLEERELIEEKLKLWKRYSAKTTKLYVLCAYNSQDENDIIDTFERIKILMKYGCLPYIMRYESYKDSPWRTLYVQIARWCNQPQFFKKKSFRQFCEANQDYHKNPKTVCAAYQSMMDFEAAFPAIAKKYFDLRFDEENQYGNYYGYGRKYIN